MHGSGQVGDEVHGYAERRQSLDGLNPYIYISYRIKTINIISYQR